MLAAGKPLEDGHSAEIPPAGQRHIAKGNDLIEISVPDRELIRAVRHTIDAETTVFVCLHRGEISTGTTGRVETNPGSGVRQRVVCSAVDQSLQRRTGHVHVGDGSGDIIGATWVHCRGPLWTNKANKNVPTGRSELLEEGRLTRFHPGINDLGTLDRCRLYPCVI